MAKNVRLREKDFEDQLSFLVKDNDDYNDEKRDGIILERGAEMERKVHLSIINQSPTATVAEQSGW